MMDYCTEVVSFINYTLSKLRNISGGGIRCSCKMCKNKKILDLDVVTILFYKRVHEEIFVLVCTQRTICSLRDHCRKDGWVNL
jgi:hypothetical protein